MFDVRREKDFVPVPDWLGPFWLTVMVVTDRTREETGEREESWARSAVRTS